MTHTTQAKIGVFGIGLAAYWPQFEGLKENSRAISVKSKRSCAASAAR